MRRAVRAQAKKIKGATRLRAIPFSCSQSRMILGLASQRAGESNHTRSEPKRNSGNAPSNKHSSTRLGCSTQNRWMQINWSQPARPMDLPPCQTLGQLLLRMPEGLVGARKCLARCLRGSDTSKSLRKSRGIDFPQQCHVFVVRALEDFT